ncbi:SGNH/GDSL hydrolase family protein [Luteipulveratus mongoliensis]|uniref:GDSL family lipase n=1 Tax=Luteipulveratus mongoliensis TaxID=571913 RepID=A0A0K1JFX4_9MICO|nr:SGNH/GDSL hydrolase family protein [Luteipulveratus mongoliensis]AKU15604.1 GDSL family lipase [Luteipulveratus mongoliensis]
MSRRSMGSAFAALTLAVASAAAGMTSASATPDPGPGSRPTATTSFTKYVALGDSYSAGPLIPTNSTWCFRSTNNYPAWLATDLGLYYKAGAFNDVSCSSADTTNLTQSQPIPTPDAPQGTAAPQANALKSDTDLVTLGMGGNDYSVFGSLVGTCPGLRDSDPTGAPCQAHFTVNGVDTLKASLVKTEKNLEGNIDTIHKRSPKATVVLVGYPRLVPPSGYCPDQVPFAEGDYAWADSINRALNTAVSTAAKNKGALFVDTYGPALGHDACAGSAAWVNGQYSNVLKAAAYHPLAAGMRAESKLIYAALTGIKTG